jgi:methionyl-tRNA formyltransferase
MMSIQTADSELMLLEIRPSGGKLMSWRDFVNGRHVQPGDRFVGIEQVV